MNKRNLLYINKRDLLLPGVNAVVSRV